MKVSKDFYSHERIILVELLKNIHFYFFGFLRRLTISEYILTYAYIKHKFININIHLFKTNYSCKVIGYVDNKILFFVFI